MTRIFVLATLISVATCACYNGETKTPASLEQKEHISCGVIQNHAMTNLTLVITQEGLVNKIKKNSSQAHYIIQEEFMPLLEDNQKVNREISLRKCHRQLEKIMEAWTPHFTEKEIQIVMNSFKENIEEHVGLPATRGALMKAPDPDKLLPSQTVANLLCFYRGVLEALAPYVDKTTTLKTKDEKRKDA